MISPVPLYPHQQMYDDIADLYLEIFPINDAFLDFLTAYLGDRGSAVLDLGCGPGDYVDALTRSGYRAVGIDSSHGMIAKAQAHKQGIFHKLSFTEIGKLDGGFDCIYCVGNSLSYLSQETRGAFLKDVQQLLDPSGVFILQVVNWHKLAQARSSDFPIKSLSEGRTFHRHYEWISRRKVIFHTEIQKEGEVQNSWADSLYPIYLEEISNDLKAAGLRRSAQLGDYQGAAFVPLSSPAMILVGAMSSLP